MATSRQLERIDAVTTSPIYSHLSETLTGASSIRAYGVVKKFTERSDQLVDENNMAYYPSITSYRLVS